MNLGAGRVVYQNFTRISKAIDDGSFFENEALLEAVNKAVAAGKAVHILGLVSPGGVHSHHEQIMAMSELAARQGATAIYIHGFTDGRDTPPRSAQDPLAEIDAKLSDLGVGRIASLTGRYFAMDRDNRWERVEQAYNAIVLGQAEYQAESAKAAIDAAYERDENDEIVDILLPASTYNHSGGSYKTKNATYLELFTGLSKAEMQAVIDTDHSDIVAGASNTNALINELFEAFISEVA